MKKKELLLKGKVPCEIFSRVCGYYQPISAWNKGKRGEFEDRKNYNINSVDRSPNAKNSK